MAENSRAGSKKKRKPGIEAIDPTTIEGRARPSHIVPREPIFLASQLASICDVDLKTIHNWCDRPNADDPSAQLECFRTPGGHLRFRHSAVLRFLTRWGYPIPDALLVDRPHMLVVEPDEASRERLIMALGLLRPGEEIGYAEDGSPIAHPLTPTEGTAPVATGKVPALERASSTLGLFASPRWYVHIWDDPYAALVAVGERAGAGAALDLAVLSVPMAGLDERAWIRTMRERPATQDMRFVLLTADGRNANVGEEMGVVGAVSRGRLDTLRELLDDQGTQLMALLGDRMAALTEAKPAPVDRRRRTPIAPREPIYVASQVAHIWNVDLKTVHNWVERGDIEAFCTPGRHLRFRRRSLLHFLRRYNMAIPEELAPDRPRVMIVDADSRSARRLAATLTDLFEVITSSDPVAALTEVGVQCSGANLIDAVVVTFPVEGVDDCRWIDALSRHPDTRYTRVVVVAPESLHRREWQELGAIGTVQDQSAEQVAPVLEKALGLSH